MLMMDARGLHRLRVASGNTILYFGNVRVSSLKYISGSYILPLQGLALYLTAIALWIFNISKAKTVKQASHGSCSATLTVKVGSEFIAYVQPRTTNK